MVNTLSNWDNYVSNCPFCGSKADRLKIRSEVIEREMGHDAPCSAITKVWVECTYCGASGSKKTIDAVYPSEIEAAAIVGWNRRAI